MKTLVTGATGFVGACLTRRLVAEGHDVHVFVRPCSDRWRLAGVSGSIAISEVDLRDASAVDEAVAHVSPGVIFHCATYGGYYFQRQPADIIETNFNGTVNLLDACMRRGFDCFINTGSSSEYGVKTIPLTEDVLPEPLGHYSVSKTAATLYCRSIAIEKKLPIVTVRLFSPYGPRDGGTRLIPHVITSLLEGNSPRLASPDSVRDYIFIDDVLDLYLKLASQPSSGEIINAGSGCQHSVGDVVSEIYRLIGGPSPEWGATVQKRQEPQMWKADVSKAARLLQWHPQTELREGLRKTVSWFRDNLSFYAAGNDR